MKFINPNAKIFNDLVGKKIISVEYSNERDAADYVILHFTDGTSVKLTSNAQVNDITWIRAERA